MTSETLFVFVVIGVASVLFASGRVRLDVVALLGLKLDREARRLSE